MFVMIKSYEKMSVIILLYDAKHKLSIKFEKHIKINECMVRKCISYDKLDIFIYLIVISIPNRGTVILYLQNNMDANIMPFCYF
jgi:hypothetical protein